MDEVTRGMVDWVLGHEGGYVNDPADPGGETKWGISKRQYPTLDIKGLTREQAVEIYVRDYLLATRIVRILPFPLRIQMFDFAVNSGAPRAVKELQKLLDVTVDGLLGPVTLAAVNGHPDPIALNNALVDARVKFLDGLVEKRPKFAKFQRGWRKRAESFRLKG